MAKYHNFDFVTMQRLGEVARHVKAMPFIQSFQQPKSIGKVSHKRIQDFLAIDIETNADGEVMLMGWGKYNPRTEQYGYDFVYRNEIGADGILKELLRLTKHCFTYPYTVPKDASGTKVPKKSIIHWNNLEQQVLLRLFWEVGGLVNEEGYEEIVSSSKRAIAGVDGKYDKKLGEWTVPPVASVDILVDGVSYEFGIKKIIGKSTQFYYINHAKKEAIYTVDMFDASQFWKGSLEKNATDQLRTITDENGQERTVLYQNLQFHYVKGSKDVHVVDWERFEIGFEAGNSAEDQLDQYVQDVLYANLMDVEACYGLHQLTQQMVFDTFGFYPAYYYSTGSLVDMILASRLTQQEKVQISLAGLKDKWQIDGLEKKLRKQILDMSVDSYSAAIIELLKKGYYRNVGILDINSSYPASMRTLPNLYNATILSGYGKDSMPTLTKNDVCFVTVQLKLPIKEIYSSVLIREQNKDGMKHSDLQRVRAGGEFITTLPYTEVLYVEKQAKKRGHSVVKDIKEWVVFQTDGTPSPYRNIIDWLYELRMTMMNNADPNEHIVKTVLASLYGKTIQTNAEYIDGGDEGILFAGHQAGSWYNIIYSSLVTSYSRIRLMEMAEEIESNGGKVIQFMTDALVFDMRDETDATKFTRKRFPSFLKDLDGFEENGWDEKKILGLFSKPEHAQNAFFYNTMMYEYQNPNDLEYTVKIMGYNLDRERDIEARYALQHRRMPTKEEMEQEMKELKYHSFLLRKVGEAFDYKREHFKQHGDDTGLGIRLFNKQLVTFGEVANETKDPSQVGRIETSERIVTLDNFYPKRKGIIRENGRFIAKDFVELEMLEEGNIDSVTIDADEFNPNEMGAIFGGKYSPLDNRLIHIHDMWDLEDKPEKFLIRDFVPERPKSSTPKGSNSAKTRKELSDQVNAHLDVLIDDLKVRYPEMTKFQQKTRNGKNPAFIDGTDEKNADTMTVQEVRELLQSKGITPLA